jgi:signal transduction histidine kinase
MECSMKQKLIRLSRRYVAALRKHLAPGARTSQKPALALGRQAVVLELETLGLARIHEASLAVLNLTAGKKGLIKRAQHFFNEAIIPILETHQAARANRITLNRMNKMLGQFTGDLAATKRQLKQGIVRRITAETALKTAGMDYTRLLKESLTLQDGLQRLTHQVLTDQEDERKHISTELRDEIAQTLMGINVRLLSLKQCGRGDLNELKNQIANTQRLVLKSAKSVRRYAHELKTPQTAKVAGPA